MEHCFWILKLIQLPYVWLVSGSKEAQGGWHVLSAFPPVDVDEFSHWLNKLLGCAFWGCFTWNPSWCGGFIEWVVWDGFGVCCLPLLVVVRVGVSRETIPLMDGILLITPPCFTWNMAGCCRCWKAGCGVSRETHVWWVSKARGFTWNMGVLGLVGYVYGKLGCVFLVAEWASVAGLFSPFQRRMCMMVRTEGMVLDISFMAAWWFHVKHDWWLVCERHRFSYRSLWEPDGVWCFTWNIGISVSNILRTCSCVL